MSDLNAKDKLIRAKCDLIRDEPFYGSIATMLILKEDRETPTAGVNLNLELSYNPKFIDRLNREQVLTVLKHEILHLALNHLERFEQLKHDTKSAKKWNTATDIVINNMLDASVVNSIYRLFGEQVEFDYDEFRCKTFTIRDISKKTAEQIYDEIPDPPSGLTLVGIMKPSKGLKTPTDIANASRRIKEIVVSAYQTAKLQGKVPEGIERIIGKLLKPQVNWRTLLWRYITEMLPIDYTYSKPHRKSQLYGYYIPNIKKEQLELAIAIDTSGSITEKEFRQFASEIVSIVKQFEQIKATVITCDAKIHDEFELTNGNIGKFLKTKLHGGGGTDFRPVFNKLKNTNTKLLIYLTDGYGDYPKYKPTFRTIWVLSPEHISKKEIPFGEVIELK